MASTLPAPSLRQLQLVTSTEPSPNSASSSSSQAAAEFVRPMPQRRQSSISYNSSSQYSNDTHTSPSKLLNRRNSVDYSRSSPISPPQTHRRRLRPLSIAIPNHNHPSFSSGSVQIRPQTLTERYAGFLATIAQKEAQVSEMRTQLTAQERELAVLKRQWEKVVRNHLAFPDRENDSLTGVDGLDKILRGIQSAAVTVSDAASEASSASPSPVFSRLSLDSTAPSLSGEMTSPDTSVDIHPPSKLPYGSSSPPRTSNVARRRSLVVKERKNSYSSPTGSAPRSSSSISPSSSTSQPKFRAKPSPRQRDNALAPLPGTALSSAAFSLLPQLTNMNLSDIKGGMDKIISPQQQKRASRVFEGLWGAVASPSAAAAAAARKEKKKTERDQVNLLEMDASDQDDNDDTIMPSRSSQFTVMAPDSRLHDPKSNASSQELEIDLSITASPSGYLTKSPAFDVSAHPIKEDERESTTEEGMDSEDGWNW